MRMNSWVAMLAAAIVLLLAPPPAHALCVGPLCSCSVGTSNVAFGSINPIAGGVTDSTGQVRVSCGGVAGLLIPYQVDLSRGGGASVAARRLFKGTDQLAYNLYSDASRLVLWGDATGGTSVSGSITLDIAGSSPTVNLTVYGRIPAGQTSTIPGSYADSITVTVTYY